MDFEKLMNSFNNEVEKKQKELCKARAREIEKLAREASDDVLMRNLEKFRNDGEDDLAEVVERVARRRGLI